MWRKLKKDWDLIMSGLYMLVVILVACSPFITVGILAILAIVALWKYINAPIN